ncbi:MAG TPA: hypothetical protein VI248_15810 [Kineosporiaceae bacterium]
MTDLTAPGWTSRIVHGTFDTFPRVRPTARRPGWFDVHLPFRVQVDRSQSTTVISHRLQVTVDGQPWSALTQTRTITPEYLDWLQNRQGQEGIFDFDRLPPYLEMQDLLGRPDVRYIEALVPAVPPGALVAYTIQASLDGQAAGVTLDSPGYTVRALRPRFDREDIRRIYIPAPGRAEQAWVLYHRREEAFDQYRIDTVALRPPGDAAGGQAPERPDLVVTVGTTTTDLRSADQTDLPLVDLASDSVTLAVPADGETPPPITVRYAGGEAVTVDPAAAVQAGVARVMFVNFAIQGLNDYFGTASSDYSPPRTYAQLTMRDPKASFSSRPDTKENGVGDGYAFTLEAHRRYGIPQLWVMNGGLLALLAHDCPEDLVQIREDVRNRVLMPALTGYPAHRMPYFRPATNIAALTVGAEAVSALVGGARPVYYPDSRIYVNDEPTNAALRAAGIRYLVVDGGPEGAGLDTPLPVVADVDPPLFATAPDGRWVNWAYQWRDPSTNLRVLFIDPELKDNLFGPDTRAGEDEARRGKAPYSIRRKFMEIAAQPVVRKNNVLVYSDDADKASGNGWFDGLTFAPNIRYQAALSWIRAHPWVQAITTDDLDREEPIGALKLIKASDPYITTPDNTLVGSRGELAFDCWYDEWRKVAVPWLGETLGAMSDRAEETLERWPVRNELYELGRLYFLMCLHESQWSKSARVEAGRRTSADFTPEDFVVAESIQLRNAHVYLGAAVWADWASRQTAPAAHVDSGPVIDRVAALEADLDAAHPAPWRLRCRSAAGLQWDHDPLPNVILYNEQALVVIDRNGGRITHLFSMVDGQPRSVSGTFKAYQFLDVDWDSTAGVECDGIVLQNTVYGPNHAYVACDVEPSRGTLGESPRDDSLTQWYYPDNFNCYVVQDLAPTATGPSVTLLYGSSTPDVEAPVTLKELAELLTRDLEERLNGRAGVGGVPGVVLHDLERFGAFQKTITLEGRTVVVRYRNTKPGHLVANEFCVDLWASAMRGRRQTRYLRVDPATGSAVADVVNEAGLTVSLTLGKGCTFSPATTAPLDPPTQESLRLHRVMTDTVEVVATGAEGFDFQITLPDRTGRGDPQGARV